MHVILRKTYDLRVLVSLGYDQGVLHTNIPDYHYNLSMIILVWYQHVLVIT